MSELAAEVVSILQSGFVHNYCAIATSTLVFYDHAITLNNEIELIWRRKFSSVTLLFHLTRWTTLLWAVATLLLIFLPVDTIPR
ncbi:hypothetical protein OBBRIDRAFT_794213 [Obba rivulosa]|uniref:DUF6533 domain-containing protein n=1 Tax=Obba rivulosa TaxID=1052685 RepID=A0A8E2AWP1_9APHY|nr:hypothetical protein OBBRIDRAFT_794213 [Obba rivulosa]